MLTALNSPSDKFSFWDTVTTCLSQVDVIFSGFLAPDLLLNFLIISDAHIELWDEFITGNEYGF